MAKISCDPEVFVGKMPKTTLDAGLHSDYVVAKPNRTYHKFLPQFNEEPIPICGLIGGTKEVPIEIPLSKAGYLMQEDGTALEFNIPPANAGHMFSEHIRYALTRLHQFLFKKELVILPISTAKFEQRELEKYPQALRLGCSPDFDAYTVAARPTPRVETFGGLRFAGGHIHMSFENKENMPAEFVIRLMDLYLGLTTLGIDPQGPRRKVYGQAGLFRPTKYPDGTSGVEYRTLSNFWIFDREVCPWIGTTVLRVLSNIEANPYVYLGLLKLGLWSEIPDIIAEEDYKNALKVVNSINKNEPLPWYPEMWSAL